MQPGAGYSTGKAQEERQMPHALFEDRTEITPSEKNGRRIYRYRGLRVTTSRLSLNQKRATTTIAKITSNSSVPFSLNMIVAAYCT